MFVGVGYTVVGVFMGMGVMMLVAADVIMINMHNKCSFSFFLYYNGRGGACQRIFIPHRGLRKKQKNSIIMYI
jgi:hypothetical protein